MIKEDRNEDAKRVEEEEREIVKALKEKQLKYSEHVRQAMLPEID